MNLTLRPALSIILVTLLLISNPLSSQQPLSSIEPLSAADLLGLKSCSEVQLNPDGSEVLYSLSTPRGPNENPGSAHSIYYRMKISDKSQVPLFDGEIKGSSPLWSPDGKYIGFLYSKDGEARQVWAMPAGGGKWIKLTNAPAGVSSFRWQPGKKGVAYLSGTPESPKEKELKDRGYGFIYYEENLKDNHLYISSFDDNWEQTSLWQVTEAGNVWDFEFNRQGTSIAVTISPLNLIDHRYMFRKIHVIDLKSGDMKVVSKNEGKLGNYAFSPDGKHLAYAATLHLNDHEASQAYVTNLQTGVVKNLTPDKFRGHISWVNWKDNSNLIYMSGEGVYPKLSQVPAKGGNRKVLLDASRNGIIFSTPQFSEDLEHFVFTGATPSDRSNIYHWDGKSKKISQLTDINPILKSRTLGKQEVIQYNARDGQEIEGLVIHPVGYMSGNSYPLIVYVHGGPESHHTNS